MRVVFDASTVVGAALKPASLPRRAILLAQDRHVLVWSNAVFGEITSVLERPKFARSIPPKVRYEMLWLLLSGAIWVEPAMEITDCRDPRDNIYLELAAAAGAAVIVSSDQDLLTLHPWRGIRIVNARDFLMLEGEPS